MTKMLYQGHGSYRFTLNDGTVVYVDPFAGQGYDLPADLILVTHEHFDHSQVDMMPHAPGCEIVRGSKCAAALHAARKAGAPLIGNEFATRSHGVDIQPVEACNKNHKIDACVGFVLGFDGLTFYASGDTSTTDDMRSGDLAKLNLDFAAYPGDGMYNMSVEEASACAKLVGAKHDIPIHLVPIKDPNDPSQLFSLERARQFQSENRLIVQPGEEIEL